MVLWWRSVLKDVRGWHSLKRSWLENFLWKTDILGASGLRGSSRRYVMENGKKKCNENLMTDGKVDMSID